MSDVLLGHGYYLRFDPKQWAAAQPYPPLGTLYAAAHAVALGEADLTVADAVDALRCGRALDTVAGLAFRGRDGRLVRTAPRPFLRDLDSLPPPARDLVDLDRYRAVWRARHGYHS